MKAAKEFVASQKRELKSLWANKRQLAFQFFNLAMIVLSALDMERTYARTRAESPWLSSSAAEEPAFNVVISYF